MLYGCDGRWWDKNDGVPSFRNLKLTNAIEAVVKFPELNKIKVLKDCHSFLLSEPGIIGDGKNSGFQAINLALQFGARFIVLVGFDMRIDKGTHWHGRHKGALNNPRDQNVIRWRMRLQEQAPFIEKIGATILNASLVSHLGIYPKVELLEALNAFGPRSPRPRHNHKHRSGQTASAR